LFWSGLEDEARDLLRGATASVLIVAPFIKEPALLPLLGELQSGVVVEVYTRWQADEVASRVSDTSILPVIESRRGTLGLIDELHAKVFAADLTSCLIGSANVTAAGLGTSRRPNLEMMHRVDDAPGSLALFAAELRKRARPATAEERQRIEEQAALLRPQLPPVTHPDAAPPEAPQDLQPWVPRFRSPDRLYRLYSDPTWITSAEPDDPALADLIDLGIPGDLSRERFEDAVRRTLLASPGARLVDNLLAEPQRFGAISAALAALLPEATHPQRQAAAQTLIRWLLHFAPQRYRMDAPNYSEILSRR
jgi:hypothetical protein